MKAVYLNKSRKLAYEEVQTPKPKNGESRR